MVAEASAPVGGRRKMISMIKIPSCPHMLRAVTLPPGIVGFTLTDSCTL